MTVTTQAIAYEGQNCPQIAGGADGRSAYLELLKRTLTNLIYFEGEVRQEKTPRPLSRLLINLFNGSGSKSKQLAVIDKSPADVNRRLDGIDWPPFAHTMVGIKRLNNIQYCLEQIFADGIPGDILEAGVWRGGASILMQAMIALYGEKDRTLWLADSFAGLPAPNENKYPADAGDPLHQFDELAVSLETVKGNFARYGLLDDRVRFLKGWFSETLPAAPVENLALIRADGDMYESTMDILTNLYPKLSPGGFIIIDDFQIPACVKAVHDYRDANGISEEIVKIDWAGVYWRRS